MYKYEVTVFERGKTVFYGYVERPGIRQAVRDVCKTLPNGSYDVQVKGRYVTLYYRVDVEGAAIRLMSVAYGEERKGGVK